MRYEINRTEGGGVEILEDGFVAASWKKLPEPILHDKVRAWVNRRRNEAAREADRLRVQARGAQEEADALGDLDLLAPFETCADCGDVLHEIDDYETEDGRICIDCAGARMRARASARMRARIEGGA